MVVLEGGSLEHHRSGFDDGRGSGGGGVVDDCVETVVVIGGVLNGTDGAISFMEGVRTFHHITVAGFLLRLLVTGVPVSYGAYPKYEYTYSVADGHTGDKKSQQESRDGDVVKGSYSFLEADGSVRTVEYVADDHNGFNAVVHNSAPTAVPAFIKPAPVLFKAPALQYYHH
ncbi:unnamed protein product [Diatraea saccharalis]|uniref:Uncharacterized protein n=1 Tax=Diatraea saccharalis TaxID=40085 RepID=A0A9N9QWU3_9NEOP|nr:unnamed protein product [Diatraea saccharalis]